MPIDGGDLDDRARGARRCKAAEQASGDPDDPKYGPVGKQRIEDTGPLTKKRMETIDDEVADARVDFIERQHAAGHAVLRVVQHHPHALPHAHQAGERRPGRAAGSRRTTTR